MVLYRYINMLYCGRILYIDDFVTDTQCRSRGFGSHLIAHLRTEAAAKDCAEIQLISRAIREQAHPFYYREDFGVECFHFRSKITGPDRVR